MPEFDDDGMVSDDTLTTLRDWLGPEGPYTRRKQHDWRKQGVEYRFCIQWEETSDEVHVYKREGFHPLLSLNHIASFPADGRLRKLPKLLGVIKSPWTDNLTCEDEEEANAPIDPPDC